MRKDESKSIGKYILFCFTVLRFDPFRFFRSFRRRGVDEFRMEEAFVQRERVSERKERSLVKRKSIIVRNIAERQLIKQRERERESPHTQAPLPFPYTIGNS